MAAKRAKFDAGKPPPGYVDSEVIRLTREGVWMADGEEISHEPTVRLFARSLKKDEQGYFLHIGYEMKRIEVEDTAYFVTGLTGSTAEGFTLRLNDGRSEKLDPKTLRYQPGRLTCRVGQDGDSDEVKFLHAAYHEILRDVREVEGETGKYFIQVAGERILL